MGLSAILRFGGGEGGRPLQGDDGICGRGGMSYMEGGTLLSMRNRVGRRHISSAGGMSCGNALPVLLSCIDFGFSVWTQTA